MERRPQLFAERRSGENIYRTRIRVSDPVEWTRIINRVKDMPGRRWDAKTSCWLIPATPENRGTLADLGFLITDPPAPSTEDPLAWQGIALDPSRTNGLYPYQLDSLRFLIHRKGKGLIGDDMGTGKTIQALGFLRYYPKMRPALLIVTAQTKLQWADQIRRWLPGEEPLLLNGLTPEKIPEDAGIIVINWDILAQWTGEENPETHRFKMNGPLASVPWKIIVADECQALGNPSAKRTKATRGLCRKTPGFLPMSGTPVRTRPAQFFAVLNMLARDIFPNHWKFLHRYCGPKMGAFGMEFKGASNIEELHSLISPLMIRRTKAEVCKDLPARTYSVVPLEMESQEGEIREMIEKIGDLPPATIRERLEVLKNSAYLLKRKGVHQWIRDFIDSGEKLIVFAYHRSVVDDLTETFGKESVKIYGGISQKERTDAIRRFVRGDRTRLLIGNILAAGVGIDGLQTVCSHAAFVEFAWSPSDHSQAEDRIHRIGQEMPVTYHYLIGTGSIDEDFMDTLSERRDVIGKLIDGKSPGEGDFLTGVTKRLRRKYLLEDGKDSRPVQKITRKRLPAVVQQGEEVEG